MGYEPVRHCRQGDRGYYHPRLGSLRTLPVGLAFFQGRYTSNIPLMAAGSIIVAGPIVLVYVIFQRYFIKGLLGGAVKG